MILDIILCVLNLLIDFNLAPVPVLTRRVKIALTIFTLTLALWEAFHSQSTVSTDMIVLITWVRALYNGYYNW